MANLRMKLFGSSRRKEYWRIMGGWLFVTFVCVLLWTQLPENPYPAETYMSDSEVFQQQVLTLVIFLSLAIGLVYFGRFLELVSYEEPKEQN